MLVVALISGGVLAYSKMRVDIFPSLNVPKIYVFLDYVGMSPDQMEGFIVNQLELYFQYVDGIQDINIAEHPAGLPVRALVLPRHRHGPGDGPGRGDVRPRHVVDAQGHLAADDHADGRRQRPGRLPRAGEQGSLAGAAGRLAQNLIRPQVQKNVPGTVAISPFGPNMRSIIIRVDPQKLRDYNLTPQHVVDALAKGNTIVPAGNIYIKDSMPIVANNATVVDIQRLGTIPLKLGRNVYLRDVATIQDDTDITYGYALVNGKKSVYLPIIKKDTGSTLTVVADTRKSMKLFRSVVPREYRDKVKISFEFDESPTVLAAVESVATEGLIGAGLTGLMIFLFLRDLRSVVVVVANIPLALLGIVGRALADGQHDQHHVAGRHGAVDRHPRRYVDGDDRERARADGSSTPKIATAVLRASNATAVPILLALLCILSVFVPAFIMERPAPVALHAADTGGRLRHDLVVPALDHVRADLVRLPAQAQGAGERSRGLFDRLLDVYGKAVEWLGPPALVGGPGLPGGVRPDPLAGGVAGRHRAVPTSGFGRVRAPVPAAARLELRADPADGREVPRGDRAARRRPRTSRSRWASSARSPRTSASTTWCSSCAGRTTASCGSPSARTAGSSSTSFASGSARSCPNG